MTVFQLILLGASAFFAFKMYEHIQTLKDPQERENEPRRADSFSTFDPKALVQKADDAFQDGDPKKALALLNEANVKEPYNSETLFKIGYILQEQNDNDEALKYYKQALEVDNNNQFIHNSIASLYKKNGEFISAKMHLNASLEIDSKNAITYYNYGNLLVDMQRDDEAINMYEKALEINSDFSEAKEEIEKLK